MQPAHATQENEDHMSIHTRSIKEIHEVPMRFITRGLASELDDAKVQSLIETLRDPQTQHKVPPIDVFWVQGQENPQNNYYFAFGGCHRWGINIQNDDMYCVALNSNNLFRVCEWRFEAHRRMGAPTIRAKIVRATASDIHTYLGSATPPMP